MTCITCANATVKSPTGGKSVHRQSMWRLGFVGCRQDREEGKTYSATAERECAKWQQATPEELRLRSPR